LVGVEKKKKKGKEGGRGGGLKSTVALPRVPKEEERGMPSRGFSTRTRIGYTMIACKKKEKRAHHTVYAEI